MAVQSGQTTMAVWGDEAGTLDFGKTGSKYFIVCSIVTPVGGTIAEDLLSLRHGLAIDGVELLPEGFHATEDLQVVRDRVFALLAGRQIRADASLYRKDKVYDYIRKRADFLDYFYRLAWYLHFRNVLPEEVHETIPVPALRGVGAFGARAFSGGANAFLLARVGKRCMQLLQPVQSD